MKSARAHASDDDDKKDYFDKDNRRIKQRLTKTNSELAITRARERAFSSSRTLFFFVYVLSFALFFPREFVGEKEEKALSNARVRADVWR